MKRKLRLLAIPARYFLTLFLTFFALAAVSQRTVKGKVTGPDAKPVFGATVAVKNTNVATTTDADGSYSITLPANSNILVFSYVGYDVSEVSAAGDQVDVVMKLQTSTLNEVVVTGYSTQRKKDIIGAVSVVDVGDLKTNPSSNLAVQLQGRASGVVVSSTGAPGAAAVVRIRGFQSFGNNDPLYIIDGVPTQDPSTLNPQDVESMQVLKDATAASIYGTRAANGVVIVTTKQGKAGRTQISYEAFYGFQKITDEMIPDLLNSQQYIQYLTQTTAAGNKHVVFGNFGSYAVPDRIVVSNAFKGGVAASDPRANPDLYSLVPGSIYQIYQTTPEGTDWFKEATRSGAIQSHQLTAAGGNDRFLYSLGMNYYNQEGTFKYTNYKRYTIRFNSTVKATNYLRFGQNVQISTENRLGNDNRGEAGAWSQSFRMVPYIPVNDIKGGWGGNGMGESGNGTNPVAQLYRQKDNTNSINKVFGNVFAELSITKYATLRTSLGVDNGNQAEKIIAYKTYERAENQTSTQLTEQSWKFNNWTWTNTLLFQKMIATNHDVKLLLGTEAIKRDSRGHRAYGETFDFDNPDFISLALSGLSNRVITNYNTGRSTIYSLFGRLDYAFKGKYLLNATMRRDGASVFGPENRYANFPSFGLGWRVSEEQFMKSISWITDLKIRAGYGEAGSISNVDPANAFSTFTSNPFTTSYDINGTNGTAQGYAANRLGNPETKWETTKSKNLGLDLSILQGKWNFTFDVFSNDTKDLLVPRLRNSLEPNLTQPNINIGTMKNSGFEFTLLNKGLIMKDLNYDVAITFTHYKNNLVKMNEEGTVRLVNLDRFSGALITKSGLPVSSFYGYKIVGFYNTPDDVAKGAKILGQPGQVGSYMFQDVNNDGNINSDDRVVLGDPHPDFQMGGNLGLNYKSFDLSAFLFWNYGNEIYNYAKNYTDMRVFVGGVSTRLLNDTWTPSHTDAKLPRLSAVSTENGFTTFVTGNSNSYYVEDGSYLRFKTLQVGYTLPRDLVQKAKLTNVRVYVQGQNLFTITKYSGPDPDLNIINNNGTDTYIGVDRTGFPNPKEFILGVSITF